MLIKDGCRRTVLISNTLQKYAYLCSQIYQAQRKNMSQENQTRLQADHQILENTIPVIQELFFPTGKESGFMLILTDHEGKVLHVAGGGPEKFSSFNVKTGDRLNENKAGQNAVAMALKYHRPVQTQGNEDPLHPFHKITCSAAPVFDAFNQIFATICVATPVGEHHTHSFGLVVAAAQAVENHLHHKNIQKELYNAQQYAFNIMNELSYGLVAMDLKGYIQWVNDTACRSLNIKRLRLLNKSITTIYPQWTDIKNKVYKGERILDLEAEFVSKNSSERYLINSYSINNEHKENMGAVITFRPFSRMLNLVSKYGTPGQSFSFNSIIYKSKAIQKLIAYAKNVASTPSTVLITGESGTGKEVFAQAIHQASSRKNANFVAINCGAISPGLIESELFGYEEGAFTGSKKGGETGKIEFADKGTLFLDEIGEMPLDMQVKLLRTLQSKSFTRVGGNKSIQVDIRIIAATNKNLQEEVKKGNFREDLYYRLNVIPLHLPALRERRMDIIPLFRHFLAQKADKLSRPIPQISNHDLKGLVHYTWPGNVRELENQAEKTVILNGKIDNLFITFTNEKPEEEKLPGFMDVEDKTHLPDMDEIEKQAIIHYLKVFDYNISQTARQLKIGRNTLYLKMKKHHIDPEKA